MIFPTNVPLRFDDFESSEVFFGKKGNIEKKRFKFKSAVDAKTHLIFTAKNMPE